MDNAERKAAADRLLYEYGLLTHLRAYGAVHLIGSYRMDLMASNDLDIDVESEQMSLARLYELSRFVLASFQPVWYEAKQDIMDGKRCYFQGFETELLGDRWNVDIWFFDREAIGAAEAYCDDIRARVEQDATLRDAILTIKHDLAARDLYRFDRYTSVDVYDAVLNRGIRTAAALIAQYQGKNGFRPA